MSDALREMRGPLGSVMLRNISFQQWQQLITAGLLMEVVRSWTKSSKSEFMVLSPHRELGVTWTSLDVAIFYVPSTCILDLPSGEREITLLTLSLVHDTKLHISCLQALFCDIIKWRTTPRTCRKKERMKQTNKDKRKIFYKNVSIKVHRVSDLESRSRSSHHLWVLSKPRSQHHLCKTFWTILVERQTKLIQQSIIITMHV